MRPERKAIVNSPAFIALFEKARARMQNPERKWCTKHKHRICAANAHVGDLCRIVRYSCYPCWRVSNEKWQQSPRGRALLDVRLRSPYGRTARKADAHAYRARKLGIAGKWSAAEFLALCEKYNNRCLCCGKHEVLTPDHVLPFCLGGLNVIANLQPLCFSCNDSKGRNATDYRNNPHPNCLKRNRRCRPKSISAPKAMPLLAVSSIESEMGIA